MIKEIKVERFDIASGLTESTVFENDDAALWFAIELSYFQAAGDWICVYGWIGTPNFPGAWPDTRWSCTSVRKVEQGVVSYCNAHE